MNNGLILSFTPESLITKWENGVETLKGTWIHVLSEKVYIAGRDEKKRVEVFFPFDEFERLKENKIFICKIEKGLRRVRTTPMDVLGRLLLSQYAEFDNDLDA
jgi:hypothetical protein